MAELFDRAQHGQPVNANALFLSVIINTSHRHVLAMFQLPYECFGSSAGAHNQHAFPIAPLLMIEPVQKDTSQHPYPAQSNSCEQRFQQEDRCWKGPNSQSEADRQKEHDAPQGHSLTDVRCIGYTRIAPVAMEEVVTPQSQGPD